MQSSGNVPPKFDACYIRTPASQGVYNKFSSPLSTSIDLFVNHRLETTVKPGRRQSIKVALVIIVVEKSPGLGVRARVKFFNHSSLHGDLEGSGEERGGLRTQGSRSKHIYGFNRSFPVGNI